MLLIPGTPECGKWKPSIVEHLGAQSQKPRGGRTIRGCGTAAPLWMATH